MCGIFGIHYFRNLNKVDIDVVRNSTDTMKHRGPDGQGYYTHENTGLGHRRLSIIDLSSGCQPMTNEDESIIIVYNGEIYNFIQLKTELVNSGHVFKTNCDTEVIIHGYEQWGIECLNKFNGMFAFIIYDKIKKSLFIARDRLGIKPLYYYMDNKLFVAASEIKALLQTNMVKARLNENVLDAYLSIGYVPGPETMFDGIKKLLPGHYITIQNDKVNEFEYWDFANIKKCTQNKEQSIELIENILIDCVEKRLISDVPIGAFLSGGLDSSIVVGLMNKITKENPINTFTVGYNQGYSETTYAKTIAENFQTNHFEFYLEAEDFFSSIETMIHFTEEPIVEPAAIALYHISKLAREHATVILSGEGSDEVFGGYYLYHLMGIIENVRKILPNVIFPYIKYANGYLQKVKHKKYLDWMVTPLNQRYQGTSSYLTESIKTKLYNPDFLEHSSNYLRNKFASYFDKVKNKDLINQMLYVDTKTWLVDDLLLKADKMTMAASVELRVPFLDYRLVEAAAAMPPSLKIRNGTGKYLLKQIAQKYLPKDIINRKKMGFPVPIKEWFKSKNKNKLSDIISNLKREHWFNAKQIDKIIEQHVAGVEDHSKLLMTLITLEEWRHQYV